MLGPVNRPDRCPSVDECKVASKSDWKKSPLTIGMLAAAMIALATVASWATGAADRIRKGRDKAIAAHSHDDRAHPSMRRQVEEMRREMRAEFKELKRILLKGAKR